MTDEEIKRRLLDLEDGWTEGKPPNVDRGDVREALVAFANFVPEGEEAILFIMLVIWDFQRSRIIFLKAIYLARIIQHPVKI